MTELLRAGRAAKKLDVSVDRLYSLTREGVVPAVSLGRMLRWSESQLNEFIESGGKRFEGGWKKRKER